MFGGWVSVKYLMLTGKSHLRRTNSSEERPAAESPAARAPASEKTWTQFSAQTDSGPKTKNQASVRCVHNSAVEIHSAAAVTAHGASYSSCCARYSTLYDSRHAAVPAYELPVSTVVWLMRRPLAQKPSGQENAAQRSAGTKNGAAWRPPRPRTTAVPATPVRLLFAVVAGQ